MPPALLTRSPQMCRPSSPGLPQAATAPVSGARKPIFTTLSAPKAIFGMDTPAMRAAAAVVERNWRRSIARIENLVVIWSLQLDWGTTVGTGDPPYAPCPWEQFSRRFEGNAGES